MKKVIIILTTGLNSITSGHLLYLKFVLLLAIFFSFFPANMAYSQELLGNDTYRVQSVEISGNEAFSDNQVRRQINLHSGKISTLWRGAEFNRRILELDVLNIRNFYRRNGYINVAISDSFAVLDNRKVAVWIQINEGDKFYLRDIVFQGNYSLSDGDLQEYFRSLNVGDPFNQYAFQQVIQEIERSYQNQGKLYVQVRYRLNSQENGIYVDVLIDENQTVTVNEINIESVPGIKNQVIRREIVLNPGEQYSRSELQDSQRRIFETGLFADVNISPVPVTQDSGEVNLQVALRTMDFRTLRFDLGARQYEPTSGSEPYTALEASLEWAHRNLMQTGRRFGITAAGRMNINDWTLLPNGEIRYTEPWLWKLRVPTTIRGFYDYNILPVSTVPIYQWGADLTFLHSQRRRLIFRSILRYQETVLSREALEDFGEQAITQQRRGQERSLGFLFRRDERDNFLYPNTGYFIEIEPEFFVDIFGGTSDFYRVEGSVSKYWRVFGNSTLAGRVKIGSIHYYDGINGFVPDYELFYLGGATSVRGFPSDRLETRLIETDDGGTRRIPAGDFVKLLANLELRFPIYWKFGGELFFDAGQLWSDYSSLNILSMRYTAGIGITFATPLGPARVDFGRKLGPLEPHERPWVTNLALQYAF